MQYPVPQFQNVEDKVIGPFTFKQFIYLAGGAGLSYTILQAIPKPFNYILILPVVGLVLALAFYKINKRSFLQIAEAAFYYLIHNKLYLWKHMRSKKKAVATMRTNKNSQVEIPNMSNSQIKQIAWNLDINENVMHADITRRDELAKQQAPSLSTAKHLKLEI